MKNHAKINSTVVITSIIVFGVVVYVIVNKIIKNKEMSKIIDIIDGNTTEDGEPIKDIIKTLPIGNFPLKIGDKNQKVYMLQKNLNNAYGTSLDLDGKFGQGLYNALCDKYWTLPCIPFVYNRDIEQSDFDSIKNYKR